VINNDKENFQLTTYMCFKTQYYKRV